MDNNVQVEVPQFQAVPGLGVVRFRDWREALAAYLASIAEEYERVGLEGSDDDDTTDN